MKQAFQKDMLAGRSSELGKPHPSLVIQCPSCQTKFAVARDVIKGLDKPRFHCSRCDNVFAWDMAEARVPLTSPLSRNSAEVDLDSAPADGSQFSQGNKFDEHEAAQASLGRQMTLDEAMSGALRADRRHSLPLPSGFDQNIRIEPPHESLEESRESSHGAEEAKFEPLSQAEAEALMAYSERYGGTLAAPTGVKNSPKSNSTFFGARFAVSGFKAMVIMALPIFGFLSLLAFIAAIMPSEPKLLAYTDSVAFAKPSLAPSDLVISQTNLRTVTLASGETVYVFSGVVRNMSNTSFKKVTLEGSLFDSQGSHLASVRAGASDELTGVNFAGLGREMLVRIANTASNKNLFGKGTAINFSFTLIPGINGPRSEVLQKARLYSLRAYTVE